MEGLCEDAHTIIVGFCTCRDVANLMSVSRKYRQIFGTDYIWVVLGKRDHPVLKIKDRDSYYDQQFLNISNSTVQAAISRNCWASNWYGAKIMNWNNKEDHLIQAYVFSIMKTMEQVYKLRKLKKLHPDNEMDWKIAINVKVDELLTRSEQERDELYEHVLSLQPCNDESMKQLVSRYRF